jgi:hypothetical protein
VAKPTRLLPCRIHKWSRQKGTECKFFIFLVSPLPNSMSIRVEADYVCVVYGLNGDGDPSLVHSSA